MEKLKFNTACKMLADDGMQVYCKISSCNTSEQLLNGFNYLELYKAKCQRNRQRIRWFWRNRYDKIFNLIYQRLLDVYNNKNHLNVLGSYFENCEDFKKIKLTKRTMKEAMFDVDK